MSESVRHAINSGKLSGDGAICKSVETQLTSLFGMKYALLTTSCTHALEMAMMMLDLQPGDEVIIPSFTFVSTANAVLRAGGKPVFCEINDRTMTIDVQDAERRMTNRTKAIVPVHYAGVAADMDAVLNVARINRSIVVVEDAAQGVNATYKKKFLGTIGDCGAYSFHDTKNYVSGEGGAFITNSGELVRKAEIIREKGTNRSNFLRGEVDKYTWVAVGSSFVQSEILAAVLKSQLEDLATIQNERKRVHQFYMKALKELESRECLRLPIIPDECQSNYHIFYILLRNETERLRVMKQMKDAGVATSFHYVPLHSSPYALEHLQTADLRLPVTDSVFERLLRLPIYPQLENSQLEYIVETLRRILK